MGQTATSSAVPAWMIVGAEGVGTVPNHRVFVKGPTRARRTGALPLWTGARMLARMISLSELVAPGGRFLGIEWHAWKAIGWLGNAVFFSRFIVQWYATERRRQVVIPVAFWWLSLAGTLLLFAYAAFYRRDSVFIFAYAFTWIPYVRNLLIHHRHQSAHRSCVGCGRASPPEAMYCAACGKVLPDEVQS